MKTVFQNVATERERAQISRGVRLSLQVVCRELLGDFLRFYASWVARQELPEDGSDRVELLRWRPFPVRFTATVETSELGARTGAYCFDQDESLACPANADEAG